MMMVAIPAGSLGVELSPEHDEVISVCCCRSRSMASPKICAQLYEILRVPVVQRVI